MLARALVGDDRGRRAQARRPACSRRRTTLAPSGRVGGDPRRVDERADAARGDLRAASRRSDLDRGDRAARSSRASVATIYTRPTGDPASEQIDGADRRQARELVARDSGRSTRRARAARRGGDRRADGADVELVEERRAALDRAGATDRASARRRRSGAATADGDGALVADGRRWTWDVAHNPDPLSPAQAGLVERVERAGDRAVVDARVRRLSVHDAARRCTCRAVVHRRRSPRSMCACGARGRDGVASAATHAERGRQPARHYRRQHRARRGDRALSRVLRDLGDRARTADRARRGEPLRRDAARRCAARRGRDRRCSPPRAASSTRVPCSTGSACCRRRGTSRYRRLRERPTLVREAIARAKTIDRRCGSTRDRIDRDRRPVASDDHDLRGPPPISPSATTLVRARAVAGSSRDPRPRARARDRSRRCVLDPARRCSRRDDLRSRRRRAGAPAGRAVRGTRAAQLGDADRRRWHAHATVPSRAGRSPASATGPRVTGRVVR